MSLKALGRIGAVLSLAAFGQALDISPESVYLKAPPQAKVRAAFSLLNDTTSTVRVQIEVQGAGDGTPWLQAAPPALKIKPGRRKVVDFKGRVPRGQGEQTAEIWARVPGGEAAPEIRLVRRVHLTIAGTENYSLVLTTPSVEAQPTQVILDVGFRNEGNVTVRPKFGAQLVLAGGTHASAYQEEMGSPVPPGGEGTARIHVPLGATAWQGQGTVTAYYRNAEGQTQKVETPIGN